MRTIAEDLRDPELPEWANATVQQRIDMMGKRRRDHDAAIITARAALSENPQ